MPAVSLRRSPLPTADPRSDAVLLALFFAQADEAAFAALVARHTPAVRAVCGGWLRCDADIDDAAQATFLVLVRKAETVRDPRKLAAWLCGVAGNVARQLRKQLDRTGPLVADPPGRTPVESDHRVEEVAAEVAILPEKYRLPVQLHYTAGLSTADIADRLGWPKGTVLTRLDRARKLLERRLSARGVSVAVLAAGVGVTRSVSAAWVLATARAAALLKCGEPAAGPDGAGGVSERSVSLTEGVVRAMTWNKLRLMLAVLMVATGVGGYAIGQWATDKADKRKADPVQTAAENTQPAKADDARAANAGDPKPMTGRRKEAVIRVPTGTFVKEIDVAPYGSGRMAWTFEEEKILGKVEGSLPMFGVEFELQTEAEYSLSSNGTIYGVITGVKVTHLKVNEALGKEAEQIKAMIGFLPLVEPLINEMLTDLPFSYQFRLVGDRLTILNYRALLAGPNPLGKLGAVVGGGGHEFAVLGYFQALGTAIEGTYTAGDAEQPEQPKKRPLFKKAGK